jgi:hypothetical protein
MTWVKLDDRYATHPKMLRAGPAALALDVAGLCYSAGHGTDGFVPAEALAAAAPFLARAKALAAAAQLVAVGRWVPVEGGWRIHDYLDYNPSTAERDERKSAAVKRTQQWRNRRRGGDTSTGERQRRGGDTSTVSTRDATPPRGLQEPTPRAPVTPPGRDAKRVTPPAASPAPAQDADSAADSPDPDPRPSLHVIRPDRPPPPKLSAQLRAGNGEIPDTAKAAADQALGPGWREKVRPRTAVDPAEFEAERQRYLAALRERFGEEFEDAPEPATDAEGEAGAP